MVALNTELDAGTRVTRIGVSVNVPEPWGELLTRRRVEAGDPRAPEIPAHVTLLGPTDIAMERFAAVEAHLSTVAAAYPPFTLGLRGTGTFRPVTEVVFVAVDAGSTECELLAAAIRDVSDLRRPTYFPYHPHVTVAQDVPPEDLDRVYDDLAGFSAAFEVRTFTLFSQCDQARWQPRREFRLGVG